MHNPRGEMNNTRFGAKNLLPVNKVLLREILPRAEIRPISQKPPEETWIILNENLAKDLLETACSR